MDKEKILEVITNAQKDINNMVENAKLLKDGIGMQFDSIPEDPKECEFGKWFYSDGQKLKTLSNNPMECLANISLLHENFHKSYYDIIKLYNEKMKKKGLFKMFSKKSELSPEELEKHLEILNDSHEKLLAELTKMERRIRATPQEKFDSIS